MSGIRLLSVQSADKRILKELLEEGVIEFGFEANGDHYGPAGDNLSLVEFNWIAGLRDRYDLICDIHELPSVSKQLLEDFLPYESMALKLGGKKINLDNAEYGRERRCILNHLRFWDYVFMKYGINAVFFHIRPHHQMEYIIYAIAKIRKIPMLIETHTSYDGLSVYGSEIETIGNAVNLAFLQIPQNRCHDGEGETLNKRLYTNIMKKTKSEKQIKQDEKRHIFDYYYGIYTSKSLKHRAGVHVKYLLTRLGLHNGICAPVDKKEVQAEKNDRYRVKRFLRNKAMFLEEYDKRAMEPDDSDMFIYFGLQMFPEETTIPTAGVFSDQFSAISILARAAATAGICVYVKEHFVQSFRDREEYDELFSTPNVKVIKSSIDSKELISKCTAVSTFTGTCILEAAEMGKPILVFSEGNNWKGMPGVYEIIDETQGAEIIKGILSGELNGANRADLNRYYCAIRAASIDIPWEKDGAEDLKRTISNSKRLVCAWINNDLNADTLIMGDV